MDMLQGERAPPRRVRRAEDDPACARWRGRLFAAVSGSLEAELDRDLRQHLDECLGCTEAYREALLFAARIGRERRLEREARECAARTRERLRLARGSSMGSRGMLLRTLLLPGFLIVLLSRGFPSEVGARAIALRGQYELGQRRLDSSDPPQSLRRGDWIVTPLDAAAELRADERRDVRVEPGSRVCIEDRELRRLLLDSGAIAVDGPCTVTTRHGALELLEGRAQLRAGPFGLEVRLEHGRGILADASAARALQTGDVATLGRPTVGGSAATGDGSGL